MKKIIKTNFHSLKDLLDLVDKKDPIWLRELESRKKGGRDWRGTDSWEETMNLVKYGWPEGRKNLTKAINIFIQEQRYSLNPFLSLDVCGAFPNVPRYVAGDPTHMFNYVREIKGSVKVINLIAYVTSSASVSGQEKINWGAALVSIIDNLETTGYSINMLWVSASKPSRGYDGPNVILSYDLKPAGTYLDYDKLSFWLINPSTLRRIELSFKERLEIERWYGDGYGIPFEASELRNYFDEDYIILNGSKGANSVEKGYEMIQGDFNAHFENLNLVSPIIDLQDNDRRTHL
jgi:hypothetical protein